MGRYGGTGRRRVVDGARADRRTGPPGVLLGILVGVLVFAGGGAGLATLATAAQPPKVDGAGAASDDTGGGAAAPVDPAAPPTYQPVARHGQRPQARATANRGGFAPTAPVKYPDGVSVVVTKIARGTEQGQGPGVFKGRPHTAFTLTLTNGTARPLDLTQVVVTTTYGTPPEVAAPVYEDPAAADFSGTVAPGGTATATYVFAVPPAQARTAVTTVDFDDTHAAATFTGLS